MNTDIVLKKLKHLAEDLRDCERRIKSQRAQLEATNEVLRTMDSEAMHIVCDKLKRQSEGLNREEQKIKMLRTGLLRIISLYENCEEKILSMEDRSGNQDFALFKVIKFFHYIEPMRLLNLKFSFQPVKGGEE